MRGTVNGWGFTRMHLLLMFPGTWTLVEFFITPTAGMLSFSSVDLEVSYHIALMFEGSPTVMAFVRLPAIQVQRSVLWQGRWILELLSTNGALVGPLSCVDPLVADEVAFLRERLVAWWAGQRPSTSVNVLVFRQMVSAKMVTSKTKIRLFCR